MELFEQLSRPVRSSFRRIQRCANLFASLCCLPVFFRSLDTNPFPLLDTTVYGIPNQGKSFRVNRSLQGKASSQPDPASALIRVFCFIEPVHIQSFWRAFFPFVCRISQSWSVFAAFGKIFDELFDTAIQKRPSSKIFHIFFKALFS